MIAVKGFPVERGRVWSGEVTTGREMYEAVRMATDVAEGHLTNHQRYCFPKDKGIRRAGQVDIGCKWSSGVLSPLYHEIHNAWERYY